MVCSHSEVGAIIQARMGSTRLPGKIMLEIEDRPMIGHVVERAKRIPNVDCVIVATSTSTREKPLVQYLRSQDIPVFRGSERDVLGRYVRAAEKFDIDTVVRLTADNPLLMPGISAQVVHVFQEKECDYASNTVVETYPTGLSTEVISSDALFEVDQRTNDPRDREHVTRYIRQHSDQFRLCSVTDEVNHSNIRWTVDREEDLKLVRKIYNALYDEKPHFDYREALNCFHEHPEWATINAHIEQKKC